MLREQTDQFAKYTESFNGRNFLRRRYTKYKVTCKTRSKRHGLLSEKQFRGEMSFPNMCRQFATDFQLMLHFPSVRVFQSEPVKLSAFAQLV